MWTAVLQSNPTEAVVKRAEGLLHHMDEVQARKHLIRQGERPEDAFLAVEAAKLLYRDSLRAEMRRR